MDQCSGGRSAVADRLAEARAAAGLTTRGVAERLKTHGGPAVTHATVANYERGVSAPSTDLLAALASVYGVSVGYFFRHVHAADGARFRKTAPLVTVAEEKKYLAGAGRHLHAYRQLEMAVGNPLTNLHTAFVVGADQSGEQLAATVRKRFGVTEGVPVVSVIHMMEQFGVRVIDMPTSSPIDGFAARFGAEHAVVLNPNVPNDRGWLNAGREWGRVLYEGCAVGARWSHKAAEGRADEFAFHLLMPPGVLREAFHGRSMVKLVQFKEQYGVSLAAMARRAGEVGVLDRRETVWLRHQFSTRGWHKLEPGVVRPDRAARFERLFEEAVLGKAVSRHDLLRVMGLPEGEMQARLDFAAGICGIRTPYARPPERA